MTTDSHDPNSYINLPLIKTTRLDGKDYQSLHPQSHSISHLFHGTCKITISFIELLVVLCLCHVYKIIIRLFLCIYYPPQIYLWIALGTFVVVVVLKYHVIVDLVSNFKHTSLKLWTTKPNLRSKCLKFELHNQYSGFIP